MNRTLDPLTFPLSGSHLIEASAGTGKTFTIALLYVRLILGHETPPLMPPDILVVTFTEAATMELRDRIRARLAEAAALFRQSSALALAPDDPLLALRALYPEEDWQTQARRLELAVEWMDEASIATIHGWCYRMLREHALESRGLFTRQIENDDALHLEAVQDYWRRFYTPLAQDQIAEVMACWTDPDELAQAIRPLLAYANHLPVRTETPETFLISQRLARQAALETLKAPWRHWPAELQTLFEDGLAHQRIQAKKLQKRYYEPWLDRLTHWATGPDEQLKLDGGWQRLAPEGMAEAWIGPPPDHPAFAALAHLKTALESLPQASSLLLAHAVHWIAQTCQRRRQEQALTGFDDLLTDFGQALEGADGSILAQRLRQQFPATLVDEFQDTDPVQYRLFDRIYNIDQNRQDCTLILIGDPKQAIYAFRSADIHTYLSARRAVATRRHTLSTNFRSTHAMVMATQTCFREAEQRPEGAFLFRRGNDDPLPWTTVRAHGRKDDFRVQGQPTAALLMSIAQSTQQSDYQRDMANACADHLAAWLGQPNTGFGASDQPWRRLTPGDVAVLVNQGHEATLVRAALARRGIRSVYLSEKGSVYETPQALEVLRWLKACADPNPGRHLRAALASWSLGLSHAELERLTWDEAAWEQRILQFRAYRDLWRERGVLPMMRRILFDFHGHERFIGLISDPLGQSGERILTDLLHLAELLQQASTLVQGEQALVRFLERQMNNPDSSDGARNSQRIRLEGESQLVQVVTLHKSKGLEYPLVFLPFAAAVRPVKKGDSPVKWHDENGALQVAPVALPAHLERAERERLAEDLRKLYVALTRARYATWVGLRPDSGEKHPVPSAINHLLGLGGISAHEDYRQALTQWIAQQAHIALVETMPEGGPPPPLPQPVPIRTVACRPRRDLVEAWRIGSYSALSLAHQDRPIPEGDDGALLEQYLESHDERAPASPALPHGTAAVHRFPRGANAGTLLHELLEWAARQGFATLLNDPRTLRDGIARRCQVRRWEVWIDPLCDWMRSLLTTDWCIGMSQLRFERVSQAKAEMEFWFEASGVDLDQLDQLVCRHTLGALPRQSLASGQLTGLFKGFIDLVLEQDGRYFVVDYKSNWLGPDDSAYTRENMVQAMLSQRYDLQLSLYLLALHRLLRSRLPDYDYDLHVGGALYLFVRGIGSATAGLHVECPPRRLIDSLDALFRGQELPS